MTKDHPFLDDIPAYALGAMDQKDVQALESHIQTCDICRAELALYQPVVEHLLIAATPQQPPARLRRQLQRPLPDAQKTFLPHFAWSFNRLVLAVVILLLVVLNILSIAQIQLLRRQRTELIHQFDTGQAALAMLASTGTKSIQINTGTVTSTLLINPDRDSALMIIWNLPELQRDQTYQAWLIDSQGHRTSAGIFQPETDLSYTSQPISHKASLSNFVGIGVTVEPAGGSQQPTGQRIFKIDF